MLGFRWLLLYIGEYFLSFSFENGANVFIRGYSFWTIGIAWMLLPGMQLPPNSRYSRTYDRC